MSDFWNGRRTLVTGCSGLLGSWMVETLLAAGADVVGLIRDVTPHSRLFSTRLIDKVTVVRGDVEEYEVIQRALNEYEIETVFHLAAQAIVGTANRSPLSTFRTNIAGTWNVLEACRQVSTVRAVVVASSDKAYGSQEHLPYTEEMPLQGRHPYDVSKSCTDLLSQTYHETYGLPVCLTRCGNFFGGGDLNFNRIIPGAIQSVLAGQAPIIRSDGLFVRDYIYVLDVVDAYLKVAERLLQNPASISGEAFNFSNESQISVLDLIHTLLRLMGRQDLKPVILNEAKSEIRNQFLSAHKARTVLGWSAAYGLEQGLIETIDWYRRHLGR